MLRPTYPLRPARLSLRPLRDDDLDELDDAILDRELRAMVTGPG